MDPCADFSPARRLCSAETCVCVGRNVCVFYVLFVYEKRLGISAKYTGSGRVPETVPLVIARASTNIERVGNVFRWEVKKCPKMKPILVHSTASLPHPSREEVHTHSYNIFRAFYQGGFRQPRLYNRRGDG